MEDLFFPQPNGRPRRHQNDRREFKKLLDEAGVPKELRLHDARHLAISMLMSGNLGVTPAPEQIIMWTGWSAVTYAEMVKVYSAQGPALITPTLTAYGEALMKRRKGKATPH